MKKNKYAIFMFLGMLIVILLLLLFFMNKEGMSDPEICKYKYLGPNQPDTPLNEKTIGWFMILYNQNMSAIGASHRLTREIFNSWMQSKFMCGEEINFYIKHKFFPINTLQKGIVNGGHIDEYLQKPFNKSNIAVVAPIRFIFGYYIYPKFEKVKQQNPSYNAVFNPIIAVYKGETPENACDFSEYVVPPAEASKIAYDIMHPACKQWTLADWCTKNPAFMGTTCKEECDARGQNAAAVQSAARINTGGVESVTAADANGMRESCKQWLLNTKDA